MNHKKNTGAKIVAAIALFAIVIGVVGTGILALYQIFGPSYNETEITQEQLDAYFESLPENITVEAESVETDDAANISE